MFDKRFTNPLEALYENDDNTVDAEIVDPNDPEDMYIPSNISGPPPVEYYNEQKPPPPKLDNVTKILKALSPQERQHWLRYVLVPMEKIKLVKYIAEFEQDCAKEYANRNKI